MVELGRLNFEFLVRHSYYVCKHSLEPLEGGLSFPEQLPAIFKVSWEEVDKLL